MPAASMTMNRKTEPLLPSTKASRLELPVQIFHAVPHLIFSERPVPNDDLHDTKFRDLPGVALVDVHVEIEISLVGRVLPDVSSFVSPEDSSFRVSAHDEPIGQRARTIADLPRRVVSNPDAPTPVAMQPIRVTGLQNPISVVSCIAGH